MRIFNHKNVARLTTHKSHRTLHTHTHTAYDRFQNGKNPNDRECGRETIGGLPFDVCACV